MTSKTYRFHINGTIGPRYLTYIRQDLPTYYSAAGNPDTGFDTLGAYPFEAGIHYNIEVEDEFITDKILELNNIASGGSQSFVDVVFAGRPVGALFLYISDVDTTSQDAEWDKLLVQSFKDNLNAGLIQTEDITPP